MLQKVVGMLSQAYIRYSKWELVIKRIIYIACFAGLCLIDQMIGSATGYIQYGLKNYTGIIIGIIILTAYKPRDFIKIPYLVWIILFFAVRFFTLDWLKAVIYNDLEVETNIWGIGIYGIVLIRMFYLFVIEKKKPRMNWFPFCVCMLMLAGMSVIRSDLAWPKALLGAFLCFYLTEFEEKDLNNLYSGMAEGIIVGFFLIQGQAWLYRPYDSADLRYLGMYSHPNINALLYVSAYSAVLCKWYLMKLKKQRVLLRVPFILLAGVIVGTTVFTGSRTAFITMGVVTVFFLLFQMLSRKKGKIIELLADSGVLVIAIVICFLPSYWLIRYVPAYVDNPIYFEGDTFRDTIQKGDPIDSEKYVELEEALKKMYSRFFGLIEKKDTNKESAKADWLDIFMPALVAEASEWSDWYAAYYNPLDEVYIAPGTDSAHPLLTYRDSLDPVKTRLSIYKYFLERLELIGEKENPQGVWIHSNYFASHTHNVFLQIAYDFGIIIGVFFIGITFMIYNKVLFGLLEKKSGSLYYRLFVTVGFASVLVVFGMLEMCWVYGQLPFTMFFIVQYIVYHKEEERLQ